jgi:hypothetical protein
MQMRNRNLLHQEVHQMRTLFHRCQRFMLILTGIAAFAGASAPIASAMINTGSYSYDCATGKSWFDQRVSDYYKLRDSNPAAAADAKRDAQAEKDRATAAGCDTSTWIVPFVVSSQPQSPVLGGYIAPPVPGPSGTRAGSVTAGLLSGSPHTL